MEKQSIGEFISILRKSKGYTQQALGEEIGVSGKAVSKWECNEGMPDISLLPALSQTLGVSIEELLLGKRQNNDVTAEGNAVKKKSEKQVESIFKQKEIRFSVLSLIAIGLVILGIAFEFFLHLFITVVEVKILLLIICILLILSGVILYFVNLIIVKGGTSLDGFDYEDSVYLSCKKKLNTKIFNYSYGFWSAIFCVFLVLVFLNYIG